MSQKKYSKQLKSNIDGKWTTKSFATLTAEEAALLNRDTAQTGIRYSLEKQNKSDNK